MPRLAIILGSGATRAQAHARLALKDRPPLDKGFFSQLRAPITDDHQLIRVKEYIHEQYQYDLSRSELDSFEAVASILYTDASIPRTQEQAYPILLDLIRFLSARIADTTNNLNPSSHRVIQRILRRKLNDLSPDEISIITFNYDLQTELALNHIQVTLGKRNHRAFVFPGCYRLSEPEIRRITGRDEIVPRGEIDYEHIGVPHTKASWLAQLVFRL